MMTYEGSPMATQAPPGYAKKILHAGLTLAEGVLEGCDASPREYKKPQSFCIMFRPKDATEADRIFSALAETAPCGYLLERPSGHSGSAWLLIDSGCRG
jgi:PhnB protein